MKHEELKTEIYDLMELCRENGSINPHKASTLVANSLVAKFKGNLVEDFKPLELPLSTHDKITLQVTNANSYQELIQIIRSLNAPVISLTRGAENPKEWDVDKIIRRIALIRQGAFPNQVTRTYGIRAKVSELVLADNYGDGWELEEVTNEGSDETNSN